LRFTLLAFVRSPLLLFGLAVARLALFLLTQLVLQVKLLTKLTEKLRYRFKQDGYFG
jgi:hypothetical protein